LDDASFSQLFDPCIMTVLCVGGSFLDAASPELCSQAHAMI